MFSAETILKGIIAVVTSELGQTIIKEVIGNYIEENNAIDQVRHNRACCLCGSSALCVDPATQRKATLHTHDCPSDSTERVERPRKKAPHRTRSK